MSAAGPLHSPKGTLEHPNYYEETPVNQDDIHIRGQYFAYSTHEGVVAGTTINVTFTINRRAKDVWPKFKDFSRWQNGHLYSGVVGDLDGKMIYLSAAASAAGVKEPGQKPIRLLYKVAQVIPEYLIVLDQPVESERVEVFPGVGRVSPGFHVFMLNEHQGKTTITALMKHASLMQEASQGRVISDEEAIGPWRAMLQEGVRKWRDEFIPHLKQLVHGA